MCITNKFINSSSSTFKHIAMRNIKLAEGGDMLIFLHVLQVCCKKILLQNQIGYRHTHSNITGLAANMPIHKSWNPVFIWVSLQIKKRTKCTWLEKGFRKIAITSCMVKNCRFQPGTHIPWNRKMFPSFNRRIFLVPRFYMYPWLLCCRDMSGGLNWKKSILDIQQKGKVLLQL